VEQVRDESLAGACLALEENRRETTGARLPVDQAADLVAQADRDGTLADQLAQDLGHRLHMRRRLRVQGGANRLEHAAAGEPERRRLDAPTGGRRRERPGVCWSVRGAPRMAYLRGR